LNQVEKLWIYDANHHYINEKTVNEETGRERFTHKNLHLATSLIINAIPSMFNDLDDPAIPHTTNRLENYFTHFKETLMLHRGLKLIAKEKLHQMVHSL